ncbi:Imm50 family immunity protein [Streptomyces sp. P9(2023)]|uniref:Imm50 family immunity protein n=1 Tax=Streptomyces sp. P9(2023) TaxID=3064394 RepID=UPI0028F42CAD|nr:Imm50 family immunity protein [Streptomyces sp. P9(2023)]MDT9691001.1 Imm50 family immunity protein [Streptomyces sp. P9(2023)]
MTWTSLLTNPLGIENIYGGYVPELTAVHLHEINFSREGPMMALRFDMPSYPETPPKKWAVQGFNTVQVTLTFAGVQDVSLTGFTFDPVVDIAMSRGDGVRLEIHSASIRLRASADAAHMAEISAYRTVDEDPLA